MALESDGAVGSYPDWYRLIASARYAGVAPWELAGIPETVGHQQWQRWIEDAMTTENQVARNRQRRRSRR